MQDHRLMFDYKNVLDVETIPDKEMPLLSDAAAQSDGNSQGLLFFY